MKTRKQSIRLAELDLVTAEDILKVLETSYRHHNTVKANKYEPTIELAQGILEKLRVFQDTLYPVYEQFGHYPRLLTLDHAKVCTTAKEIKVKNKRTGTIEKRKIRDEWGTTDIYEIARRLMDRRNGNLGWEQGDIGDGVHRTVCIEVDVKDPERQQLLLSRLGRKTLLVRSPSRKGLHVFFWTSKIIGNPRRWREGGADIDIKSTGGYVVCPGTSFQDKGTYVYDSENEWFDLKLAELPQDWENILDEFLPSPVLADKDTSSSKTRERRHRVELVSAAQAARRSSSLIIKELKEMTGAGLYEHALAGKPVPQGYRFHFCQRLAGHLEGHLHWEESKVIEKLHELRDSIFEDGDLFSDKELEKAVSWVFTERNTDREHRVELVSPRAHGSWPQFKTKLSWCEQEFVQLLCAAKANAPGVSLSEVAEVYRQYAQFRTGQLFEISIPAVVARVLRLAGFTKTVKNVRTPMGTRTKANLWRVDLSAVMEELRTLEGKPRSVAQEVALLQAEFKRVRRVRVAPTRVPTEASSVLPEPANDVLATPVAPQSNGASDEAFTRIPDLEGILAKTNQALDNSRESLLRSMTRSTEQMEFDRKWPEALQEVPCEAPSMLSIEEMWASI